MILSYMRSSSAEIKLLWFTYVTIKVYINFTSLLNSVGGLGSAGAWVRGWCELNFDISRESRVGPQKFGANKKKMTGVETLVRVRHDFIKFCYDSVKFCLACDSSIFSVFSAHAVL